jgi:hypothetical protein
VENGFVRIKLLSLKQLHLFMAPLKIAARANTPRDFWESVCFVYE